MRLFHTRFTGVLLLIVLAAVWQLVATLNVMNSSSLPTVTEILSSLWELTVSGELPSELALSLQRVAIGYGLAVIIGVGLGLAMGYSRALHNLLEPVTELLRPIPSPAYIPLAILFLGLGESMKIFVIAFSCTFPILLNTFSSIRAVDLVLVDTGRTFGAKRFDQIVKIYLPSALPGIFTGMRVALGISLIVVVIAEMVASGGGIGYFILNAQRLFQVPEMYAGIVTLAVTGYLLNLIFVVIEGRVLRWQPKSV
ncbi:ABC transporter permease [Microbacterium pseudoresistens]|uniref:ABC-type nitrate/sulfonate/bicarbonate transport system permease component n=1 Tax=Microbacterium pseudoresistens TaxID=640634 RepID=A0A7Y9JPQ4_9MICO|nr:ABC transporter permease [Microbacterium pseudoresistens]NYD54879.1 ABC-type nitrate/sulfonate/bicarbonate transport system permease component [Microbacterium pseudoresistens]